MLGRSNEWHPNSVPSVRSTGPERVYFPSRVWNAVFPHFENDQGPPQPSRLAGWNKSWQPLSARSTKATTPKHSLVRSSSEICGSSYLITETSHKMMQKRVGWFNFQRFFNVVLERESITNFIRYSQVVSDSPLNWARISFNIHLICRTIRTLTREIAYHLCASALSSSAAKARLACSTA